MKIYAGSVGTPVQLGKKAGKGSVSGNGEGVYTLDWDGAHIIAKKSVNYADNAGIICLSADQNYIYAANESKDFTGLNGSGGGVSAYRVVEDGLIALNTSVSYGSRPSYVSVTNDNRYLLAANHGSHTTVTCHYQKSEEGKWILKRGFDDASIALFHLKEDGSIGELADLHIFDGQGYWCHGGGQSTSHLHCVKVKDDLVIACNRGADTLEIMKIDREQHRLEVLNRYPVRPALAPRHFEFHPSDSLLYVLNENYPCLSVYAYDSSGQIEERQLIETVGAEYYVQNPLPHFTKRHALEEEINTSGMADFSRVMPADIHITRDGSYVYVSNRCMKGKGSITAFCVKEDGCLEQIQEVKLPGGDPRGFALLEDRWLIVSLMDQNLVQIYPLQEGKLGTVLAEEKIPSVASFAMISH